MATYVKSNIENGHLCFSSTWDYIDIVIVEIAEVTLSNIYKPPATTSPLHYRTATTPSCLPWRLATTLSGDKNKMIKTE